MNLEEMDALTNRKKKYQITLCSMMQSTEEAAAPADFPSSAKWISDYGWGKLRRYSSAR